MNTDELRPPVPMPLPEPLGSARGTEEGERRITEDNQHRNTQQNLDDPVESIN